MSVYRDKRVPVPKVVGITINRADRNRVLYRPPMSYNKSGKTGAPIAIGYICEDSSKMMYPNSNYKHLFSGDWEKYFHEKSEPNYKKFGIYTLFEAINNKTGILDMIDSAFGDKADAMKDFAMHSIINHSNVAAHFEADMKDYLLFSGSPYSDSTYSDIFEKRIKRSEIIKFKKRMGFMVPGSRRRRGLYLY